MNQRPRQLRVRMLMVEVSVVEGVVVDAGCFWVDILTSLFL